MALIQRERAEKRDLFTVTVEYFLPSNDPDNDCSKGVGQTTNISDKGLCILLHCPVDEGQCMALYGSKLSSRLITGQVRWCSKLSEGIYRVGLSLN
jgi:hypothetical protein